MQHHTIEFIHRPITSRDGLCIMIYDYILLLFLDILARILFNIGGQTVSPTSDIRKYGKILHSDHRVKRSLSSWPYEP